MIGTCEQNKHNSTNGFYRMLPDFCPAIGRIAIAYPGIVQAGETSLGIIRGPK